MTEGKKNHVKNFTWKCIGNVYLKYFDSKPKNFIISYVISDKIQKTLSYEMKLKNSAIQHIMGQNLRKSN